MLKLLSVLSMVMMVNGRCGLRGAMEKKGVQPKDHLRENKQALKELQVGVH